MFNNLKLHILNFSEKYLFRKVQNIYSIPSLSRSYKLFLNAYIHKLMYVYIFYQQLKNVYIHKQVYVYIH